jgi:hypothetical protein
VKFVIGTTPDGGYVLRFEDTSIRADVAITRADLQMLVRAATERLAADDTAGSPA